MDDTFGLSQALAEESKTSGEIEKVQAECTARAKKLLSKQIPPAKKLITSKNTHDAACPPRRAGKTFMAGSLATIVGEAKPQSVTVVFSLTLPQMRKIWWDDPAGVLRILDRTFNLKLEFYESTFKWVHQNGSVGYLISCETKARMEYARGIEADLYVVDESQAFAPGALRYLLDSIIEPARRSRKGRVVLIGTPGPIESGPFFEATCHRARHAKTKLPTNVQHGQKDPHGRDPKKNLLWVRHHWTLKDNTAMPHQWELALDMKAAKGWADDHPVWLRESMGEWAGSFDGLVYRFLLDKAGGGVTWVPEVTKDNPTGLPKAGTPWRLVGGLDLGFEAATSLAVCAYSQVLREFRHVTVISRKKLLVQGIAEMIQEANAKYGNLDIIFADTGNLGVTIVNSLIAEYGFPIEPAKKREKFDHIELVNSGFAACEIKIIDGTTLAEQLESGQWVLDDGTEEDPSKLREQLARDNKLKENSSIPNDEADAFLYSYTGAMHHFATAPKPLKEPEPGTPEWEKKRARVELANYRARPDDSPQARALSGRVAMPSAIQKALTPWKTKNSMPSRRS